MADGLTIYVAGIAKGIGVDLDGRSSRDEWDDLKALAGRWANEWVEVARADTTTIYVRRDAIIRVEVDYTAPPSPEVADKAADEEARAAVRKTMRQDQPPYIDKPSPD